MMATSPSAIPGCLLDVTLRVNGTAPATGTRIRTLPITLDMLVS